MSLSTHRPENVCEWHISPLTKRYGDQRRARIKAGVLEKMSAMKDGVLTYLDGLTASLIDEDLITTPNMSFIPFPPFGDRNVRLRVDGLYGVDDHTRWPQPYNELYPHYACIRRPIIDSASWEDLVLWASPDALGFCEADSIASDLWVVDPVEVPKFTEVAKQIRKDLQALIQDAKDAGRELPAAAQGYDAALVHTVSRLHHIPYRKNVLQLLVREVQRTLLESDGFVTYWKRFWPQFSKLRMVDEVLPAAASDLMGAFTPDPEIAQKFASAGIPIWLIRSASSISQTHTQVKQWCQPSAPSVFLCLEDTNPLSPSIWRGTADHRGKYINMHRYTITHLVFRDPWGQTIPVYNDSEFDPILRTSPSIGVVRRATSSSTVMFSSRPAGDLPNSTILPEYVQFASVTGASASASTSSSLSVPAIPAKRPSESRGGRSRKKPKSVKPGFHAPPEPPLMPSKPSAWFYAFEDAEVDVGLPRQMSQDLRHYFFPSATLFANASSPARQLANTMNWLFMRSAWIGHLMSMHQPHGLQAQEWRDLLGMTAYHSRRGETTHAQRHAEEILDRVFPGHRFNQQGPTIVYHQRTLPTNCIPPDDILRDIIWEVNEANLRMEVASLLTLEGEEKNILQVDDILRPIFPGPENTTFTFWMPIPSAQGHNRGLSADRWQDRVDAVTHLGRHLASVWDDDAMPEAMLRLRTIWNLHTTDLNADEFHALEKMIAKYYCELFYNNFGRPPTVPRRLFDIQY
ncbi:hypothetical protein FISHEDRAFT_75699 [Fistulina hepatica ATCC 64428]|uniref:Uncharacterized protein n=1 Tax=Fistulina hepatica ATCC 64428 TaxID=1128425 RepID=A0A0D7A5U4_9AGAR|nr:hypothetical protein FISHEDRAFT_75699 [Fistulina hepatica ATCC 64428]